MIPHLFETAARVQQRLRAHGFQFCFIGGLAVQRWGQPRATKDVDLTLLTGFGNEQPYIDAVLEDFEPRIDDAASFALLHRVLLLRDVNGVPIDISLGAMPFEEDAVERGSYFVVGEHTLYTCSATDLIVHKAFAARAQDWIDVRSILVRSRDSIDLELARAELRGLAELRAAPELVDQLEQLIVETRID